MVSPRRRGGRGEVLVIEHDAAGGAPRNGNVKVLRVLCASAVDLVLRLGEQLSIMAAEIRFDAPGEGLARAGDPDDGLTAEAQRAPSGPGSSACSAPLRWACDLFAEQTAP